MVVISPLAEEIYFRGLLQHGIKLTQLGWNRFFKRELTEVDVKIQRVWRIQLTALTVAASYFDRRKGLLPFVIAYIDGVSYSLMSEKYKTLSLGILSNGINSILALSLSTYPHYTEAIIFTMLSNKIGSLSVGILANNRLDQAITYTYHRLDQTLAYTKQSIHNLYDRVKLLL
jgi:hypothetical protein